MRLRVKFVRYMDGEENILEAINEEETLEDVDMLDAETLEEGEIEEQNPCIDLPVVGGKDEKLANQGSQSRNHRRKAKKKKKRRNNTGSAPTITDINRFVIDTCRRLKERKSYLIWNAVGCLGVSAVSDLVNEVEAIQAYGGQMTADGKRPRLGGGILWSILKTREPRAYKEIMAKGKEFEKQFRKQTFRKEPEKKDAAASGRIACVPSDQIEDKASYGIQSISLVQGEALHSDAHGECTSVLNRIRVPVAYDDLFGEDGKDE